MPIKKRKDGQMSEKKCRKIYSFYKEYFTKEYELEKEKVLKKVLVYPGQNPYNCAFNALAKHEESMYKAASNTASVNTLRKYKIEAAYLQHILKTFDEQG